MAVTAHRFTIGRTLKDSVQILWRNFLPFVALAIIFRLPLVLPVSEVNTALDPAAFTSMPAFLSVLVAALTGAMTKAFTLFGTLRNLRGERATVSDVISGLRILPPLIGGGALMVSPSIFYVILLSMSPGGAIAVLVISSVCGIATIVMILSWWVYAPVLAAEGNGLARALSRSRELMAGRRWSIVGLLFVMGIAMGAITILTAIAFGAPLVTIRSIEVETPVGIALFVLGAIATVFRSIVATVAYHHLRIDKEGGATDETARVFD